MALPGCRHGDCPGQRALPRRHRARAVLRLGRQQGREARPRQLLPEVPPAQPQEQLGAGQQALARFSAFPSSSPRLILLWMSSAKKLETRQRRITRTVELAAHNIRANHPSHRS
ncbi:YdeI/OmpD-associated family protein [Actinomyces sp. 2119]|uniref:YdeI/OmpD-associated family protein n=1 Tax=Actinomyces sp. 2119 TaxID=2321393 RepID=UPI0028733CB3|nr:YdeI/OmpD-associated family protein [Actinomyces sp. 2119]